MGKVIQGMTMSVDGFICDRHGDLSLLYPDMQALQRSAMLKKSIRETGAVILGRRAYDLANGDLTGYEFQVPIFVLTHHPPEQGPKGENENLRVIFVNDSIENVVAQAKAAAGEKDVTIIGGADIARQALDAHLVDELQVGVAPLLLGEGTRWFDPNGMREMQLRKTSEYEVAGVTFIYFSVLNTNL